MHKLFLGERKANR